MTKQDLINHIADNAGLSKAQAGSSLDAVISGITTGLKGGESVTLTGFGTFSTSNRAARTGRNPRTGAAIYIAASTVAKFKASKNLKETLN